MIKTYLNSKTVKRLGLLSFLAVSVFTVLAIESCTSDGSGGETQTEVTPSGLNLSVTRTGENQYNPFGNGTGEVTLRATARNTVRFRFEFGDETPVENTSGIATFTVQDEGTLDYEVEVTAISETGNELTTTQSITMYRSNAEFPTVVWADEFDYTGAPDPDKWHHQLIPILGDSWANGEQQHYVDDRDNSFVDDGTLKIVAIKEDYTFEGSTKAYTSARLNSKFAFEYGRVEVRAKLPAAGGTWPAIWTLGANIDEVGNFFGDQFGSVGWPRCGEIDIMEQRGWDKSTTLAYFHWGDTQTFAYSNEGGEIAAPNSTTEFQIYSLEWNEDAMKVYYNDQLVYELENTTGRPFDNPHYLLLNIAMGGNLGGEIPADFTESTFEIDYVRVYQ